MPRHFYCVCCQTLFEINDGKKMCVSSCCMAPMCNLCYNRPCCFCATATRGDWIRKTSISSVRIDGCRSFDSWKTYFANAQLYKESLETMQFFLFFLKAYPKKVRWYTIHTSETKALYDAYMRQSMRLFLFNRVPKHFNAGIKLSCSGEISKFSGMCFQINQMLGKFPMIRFPGRRDNIKALFGFMSKIVMRMALECHKKTNSDGLVEVVCFTNMKIGSSILRRILILK